MKKRSSDLLEKEAENRIASELARCGILVAKPYFDKDGGDLLAMLSVKDGARFIKVQCKGRSIERSKSCQVKIPEKYVTKDFVLFLYLRSPTPPGLFLYIFFEDDIASWKRNIRGQYVLSVSRSTCFEKLTSHKFDSKKEEKLIQLIQKADIKELFISLLPTNRNKITEQKEIRVIHNDQLIEVFVERSHIGVWETTSIDKITGTKMVRTACPVHPDDYAYDPKSDTWVAK